MTDYPYPFDVEETIQDEQGEINLRITVGARDQWLAAHAFIRHLDTADMRHRLAAGYARISGHDATEAERVYGKLTANRHRLDRDLAHLVGMDDGYVWRHPNDFSLIGTVLRGPDPEIGSVHLLHRTDEDELGDKSTTWAWYVVYAMAYERLPQDVMTGDGADVEYTGVTTALVCRVGKLSFPVLPPLTTRQAAELAGTTPERFRALVSDARRRHGVELQAPREQWPDGRTPMYDRAALESYLARMG